MAEMSTPRQRSAGLPVRWSLAPAYALSFVIAVLIAAASLTGILYPTAIYPAGELQRDLASLDVVNLCLGLPVLLGSMALARRGRLVGLLCWPGALFFVLYSYLIYVFAMPLNGALLLPLTLVTLSVYTLAGLIAAIDGQAVQRLLTGAAAEKIAGAALAGQGVLNLVWAAAALLYPLAAGTPAAEAALANHVTDVLITPVWVVVGVLLWRKSAFGYTAGLGVLLQGSLFILAAILLLLLKSLASSAPIALANVALLFAGGLACFVPFALYARGVVGRHG